MESWALWMTHGRDSGFCYVHLKSIDLFVSLFWQEANLAGQELKCPFCSLRLSWVAWVFPGCIAQVNQRFSWVIRDIWVSLLWLSILVHPSCFLATVDYPNSFFCFLKNQTSASSFTGHRQGLPSDENRKNGKSLSLPQISTSISFFLFWVTLSDFEHCLLDIAQNSWLLFAGELVFYELLCNYYK